MFKSEKQIFLIVWVQVLFSTMCVCVCVFVFGCIWHICLRIERLKDVNQPNLGVCTVSVSSGALTLSATAHIQALGFCFGVVLSCLSLFTLSQLRLIGWKVVILGSSLALKRQMRWKYKVEHTKVDVENCSTYWDILHKMSNVQVLFNLLIQSM